MQPEDDEEEEDEEDRIPLSSHEADDYDDGPDLGPDARDLDLMDGSWEQRYYAGQRKTRDWNAIGVGIGLLILVSLLLPMILVVVR